MVEQSQFDAHLAERRFQLLVNSVTEYAIYMLDTDGYIRNWNAGAEAIKGYTEAEIVGQHFSRFYTPEDRKAGVPALALATALSRGKYESEAWRLRKDGSRFWAHVVLDPIFDEAGRHVGFAKITRDITDRKDAQKQLEHAREALFQAQKLQALGELTGGIAHDFNNMITVIRGAAELLQREDLAPDRRRRYAASIAETADRAAELTSHLLSFGRRQALKPEVIDLNIRLDAFVDMLARTIGGAIAVRLESAGDLWPVKVDLTQLETALLNAAINARDAMPDGGTIRISTSNVPSSDGDKVCIAVCDTGPGMTEEVLSRAFEPFFTTKPVGKGTGLGLSQIHGFAAQSGGRAEIESAPGEGTIIRVLLPRAEGEVRPPVRRAAAAADSGNRRVVLLVEDNDRVRDFAEDLLTALDYRVIAVGSAEEALKVLGDARVDMVFSDVMMPGISGVQLARRIAAQHPDLPILLTSGYSLELIEGARSEFGVLSKPYSAETVAEALARAFDAAPEDAHRVEALAKTR
ncbi:MAG TPA: ATP-binding protein [Sphingomonas sp.]|nr:ATP-binding protein [Sphingomonas sp.]